MIVLSWNELLDRGLPADRPVCLTIGVFDGLHLGHQRLLSEVTAGLDAVLPLVLTFRKSPAAVTAPRTFLGAITTHRQKLERMAARGVEVVTVIDFSDEMSNLSGEAFVRLLRKNLTIQRIVVGENFRFGKKRASGTDDLRKMLSETGTELRVTEPVRRGTQAISSSRVRSAIAAGDLAEAREMLGAPHVLDLRELAQETVSARGCRVARAVIDQVLPPAGEYAVRVRRASEPGGAGHEGRCRIDKECLALYQDDRNVTGYRDDTNVTGYRDDTNVTGYRDDTNVTGYRDGDVDTVTFL